MKKVLIIDDEELICWSLQQALQKDGYDVNTTTNPEKSLEEIEKNDFDLVITDYKLGDINGIQIIEFIKKNKPSTKIILISAYSSELQDKGINYKEYNYLAKPFDIEEIKSLIQKVLI